MARHPFGGGAPDWAVSTADGVPVEPVGGAIITAWSQFLGGTQYVDLSMDAEGTQIVDHITASDGTDGLMLGQIPQFYGPDGVWELWLSANNGPRVRAQALDTADLVSEALDTIDDAAVSLGHADSMFASLGQPSGIAQLDGTGKLTATQRPTYTYSLSVLTDTSITSPATGDVLRYDASVSKWKNAAPTAWTNFTFLNSFSNGASTFFNPPQWRVASDGKTVELRGNVTVPTTAGNGAECITLPSQIMPPLAYTFAVSTSNTSSSPRTGRLDVGYNAASTLRFYYEVRPDWFSLDGIRYYL